MMRTGLFRSSWLDGPWALRKSKTSPNKRFVGMRLNDGSPVEDTGCEHAKRVSGCGNTQQARWTR